MPEGFPSGQAVATAEATAPLIPLFDRYASQVVEIRGVTGPLSALIKLCPVREDEMDPGKKEQWTADTLIEAGVEIDPEHVSPEIVEYLAKKKL